MSTGTKRAGWFLADQIASSLSNFALALLVARSVSVEEFGAFSVAFIVYLVFVEFVRALSLEPLLIRYSGATRQAWAAATRAVLGLAILVGLIALVPLALFGLGMTGQTRGVLIALAATLPGLLLQDSCRYAFFARRRPQSAFVIDTAWGVVLLATVVLVSTTAAPSAGDFVFVWGLTGTLAGLLGMWLLGVLPRFTKIRGWLEANRDIAPRFVAETLAGAGELYGTFLLVGAITGLAGIGALNAARVLMGPIGVVYLAAGSFAVSEGSRFQKQATRVSDFVGRIGALLPMGAVLWTAVLLLVPSRLGTTLLGDSWLEAKPVLLPFGIFWAARGTIVGARSGLRIFAAAKLSLRAQIIGATLVLTGGAIGATLAGPTGATIGLAIAGLAAAGVWWLQFRGEAARRAASPPTPAEGTI